MVLCDRQITSSWTARITRYNVSQRCCTVTRNKVVAVAGTPASPVPSGALEQQGSRAAGCGADPCTVPVRVPATAPDLPPDPASTPILKAAYLVGLMLLT